MPTFRRVLFPTDFSDDSAAALPHAAAIAGAFGGEVHLLHVVHEPVMLAPEAGMVSVPMPFDPAALTDAAREGLDRLTVEPPATVAARVVEFGPTADEICRYAAEQAVDLIVMGTHGRTGLAHVLLGSTAERVVRHAPCAVMTVRPRRKG